ncbi:MAG: hypothetical protein JO006_13280 [Paucibacter sp.]|nr:hypothetical protein [Roseateles sp.]
MADKNLSETNWKSFAKGRTIKDVALLKALTELPKKEKAGSAAWLEALKGLEQLVESLAREHKGDRECVAQFKLMDAAITSERKSAGKLAEQETLEAEDEEGPAALTSKLIPLLKKVRKGGTCFTLVAVDSKEAAVMLARRPPTAAARGLLKDYLANGGTPKYIPGECVFEANAFTFVLQSEAAGLAKKIKAALLKQTEQRVKVRVRGENPEDIDDDGDPADAADESGEGDVPPVAPTQAATQNEAQARAAEEARKAEQLKEFKTRLGELVPRVKALAAGGWAGARETTAAVSEAAALVASDPVAALAKLDKIKLGVDAAERPASTVAASAAPAAAASTSTPTAAATAAPMNEAQKRSAALVVEDKRMASAALGEQFKGALNKLLAEDPPNVAKLKTVIDGEFKRSKELAALLATAVEQGLPITPSPAKVGFTANEDGAANEWNEAVCKAAFKKYGWFTFKAMRKSKDPADLPGLTAQKVITDAVMWKLYQYRRYYVDGLIAKLHAAHKDAGLLFKSGGSEDIESDLDITVASPRSGVDVVAMKAFNDQVKADFGRPPGRVFDTNLYARDYNAIKDNLSAPGAAGKTKDNAIAEPVGPMSQMAGIDQDVATLMKQRRFLDEASFNKMWHALRDSMPPGKDRERIQQRFEEAEDAYLLTAREKVLEIVKTVQARLGEMPADERLRFESAHAEFVRVNAAADQARGDALTKALAEVQAALPRFLDMLEEHFPDEVMETTDALYAKSMTTLRADQGRVGELEQHFLEATQGPACEKHHKGVSHADWLAQAPAGINALKARIKQAQFTNIVFANEAYVSQGAITHIVSGAQAADPVTKAEVLARIQPAELLQSANEQMADFYKDMKHLEHGVHAAAPGKDKRRANGEAFVHASKYLSRMLDAAAMLQDKYAKDEEATRTLTATKYDMCKRANVAGPRELQAKVDELLVSLRKSSTLPGDAKAEVAVFEVQSLFGVDDIGGLRELITAFGVDFNQRARSLKAFQADQDLSRETEREYFRPA